MENFTDLIFHKDSFDSLAKQMITGSEIMRNINEFWKKYVQIEETYSKGLEQLAAQGIFQKKTKGGIFSSNIVEFKEISDLLHQSWKTILNAINKFSERHKLIASSLHNRIAKPINNYCEKSTLNLKEVLEEGKLQQTDLEHQYRNLSKVKLQYAQANTQLHQLNKQLQSSPSYDKRQKLELQISQTKMDIQNLTQQYQKCIKTITVLQRALYNEKMPQYFSSFQQIEEERVEILRSVNYSYISILHSSIPTTREVCDEILFLTDKISKESQIKTVIQHLDDNNFNNPKTFVPKIPKFKQSTDTNADSDEEDLHIEIPNDLWF